MSVGGSIRQKPTGNWEARYTLNGRTHSKTHDTKADAQAWLRRQLGDAERGVHVAPHAGRITVANWCKKWIGTRSDIKPSTVARYRVSIDNDIVPYFGNWPLNSLRASHVRQWISDLLEEKSEASARHSLRVLSMAYEAAMADQLIAGNPCKHVKAPSPPKREMLWLTPAEVERLCEHVASAEDRLLVHVLAYTGLRWGEATALTPGDYDRLRRRLSVTKAVSKVEREVSTTKSGKHRTVSVVPHLAELLDAHIDSRGLQGSDLLWSTSRGNPLHNSNWHRSVWNPALESAGLDDSVRIHDLRHTCAAWLIETGANPKEIQVWMGHSSITVTMDRYGHLFPDSLDELAEKMGALRGRAGEGPASVGGVREMGRQ